jgi:hypothetical protein
VEELRRLCTMMPGMNPTSMSNREGDGLWSVNNKAETEKAVGVDGFSNADGLAGFVLIKGRSISKMSGY